MKKIYLITMMVGMILLLVGCGSVDFTTQVNKDGSISVTHTMLLDKSFAGSLDYTEDIAKYHGFTTEKVTKDDMLGWVYKKTFATVDEYNEFLKGEYGKMIYGEGATNNISIEKKNNEYVIDGGIHLGRANEKTANSVKATYTFIAPSIKSTNGVKDSNKVTWELEFNKLNSIEVESSKTNIIHAILIIVGCMIFVAILILLIAKKEKRNVIKDTDDVVIKNHWKE